MVLRVWRHEAYLLTGVLAYPELTLYYTERAAHSRSTTLPALHVT